VLKLEEVIPLDARSPVDVITVAVKAWVLNPALVMAPEARTLDAVSAVAVTGPLASPLLVSTVVVTKDDVIPS